MIVLIAAGALAVGGCSSTASTSVPAPVGLTASAAQSRFPSVVKVSPLRASDGTWTFDVTMSSPYDSPDRYADGWRVKSGDRVFGEMTLGHDDASEQPFTRTQTNVRIPSSVGSVTIEGHDLKNGYGGKTATVPLPG
ncbi:hypothetical protein V3N99_19635 [Dermatophilaceae bacterium Soc4.6]